VTLSTWGFILQVSAGLIGFSALVGKDRLDQFELKLRNVLCRLASLSWPRAVIQTIRDASTRTLDRAHHSFWLKAFLYVAVCILFSIYILPKIFGIAKSIVENLGIWGWIIVFTLYMAAKKLSHSILAGFDIEVSEKDKRNPRATPYFIYLAITFPTAFLIIWCIWLLVQITSGLIVFPLFFFVKVLLTPYLFFDNIVLRFRLTSTFALIAYILGLTGTILRFISN
jgi:hypothetical protein